MSEFIFLNREQVDELHDFSLASYGGARGIRDEGLIESALGAAHHTFNYGGGDVFEIAATYAFHIAEAQAFFDGNKRTAIASAIAFLALNGFHPATTVEMQFTLYDAMIAIAEKRMSKSELAGVLRKLFGKAEPSKN